MTTKNKKNRSTDEAKFEEAVEELGWRGNKSVAEHFFKLGMITADSKRKLVSEGKKLRPAKVANSAKRSS